MYIKTVFKIKQRTFEYYDSPSLSFFVFKLTEESCIVIILSIKFKLYFFYVLYKYFLNSAPKHIFNLITVIIEWFFRIPSILIFLQKAVDTMFGEVQVEDWLKSTLRRE